MGYKIMVIQKMYPSPQSMIPFNDTQELLMKQYIHLDCPYCQSDDLVKNGHSENGTQRYRCNACKRSFQWEYTYTAWLPGTKDQIELQTLNGSGVRDISRTLGIAKNTVIAALKKNAARGQPGVRQTPEGETIDQARCRDLRGSG
jgi:transposase